jgi:uncharacterized membrane protein
MIKTIWSRSKQTWPVLLTLGIASLVSIGLVLARWAYTGSFSLSFLIWNLFLAWIPLGIAWLVRVLKPPLLPMVILIALWLLFFPNAPYIFTDLVHLRWYGRQGIWLDLSTTLTTALTGLFVGYTSLAWMQAAVRARWGALTGWLFVVVAVGLSGFGVYIGRFLRWNSWDIVTRPHYLLGDIAHQLFNPADFTHMWGLSLLFALVFLSAYLLAFTLPTLQHNDW